jgi:hypothetical protein
MKGGDCFMDKSKLNLLGIVLTVVGFAASVISGMISDKKTEVEIADQVKKAMADSTK